MISKIKSGMMKKVLIPLIVCMAMVSHAQQVKVWEEDLVIPTHLVKEADKNPMFFQNQSYQGASRYVYPYALEDNITNEKVNKTWKGKGSQSQSPVAILQLNQFKN